MSSIDTNPGFLVFYPSFISSSDVKCKENVRQVPSFWKNIFRPLCLEVAELKPTPRHVRIWHTGFQFQRCRLDYTLKVE
jgi:hypothetical protein